MVCGALLNHSTLSHYISLESTHWELSKDAKNKHVDLINNGPAQLQFLWPSIIIKWSVAICGPLLNHSTLPHYISLESTHWELSNDTYVDLINNAWSSSTPIFLTKQSQNNHKMVCGRLWPFVESLNITILYIIGKYSLKTFKWY